MSVGGGVWNTAISGGREVRTRGLWRTIMGTMGREDFQRCSFADLVVGEDWIWGADSYVYFK